MARFNNPNRDDLHISPLDIDNAAFTATVSSLTITNERAELTLDSLRFVFDDRVPRGEVWAHKPDGSFGPIAKDIKP